MNSAANGNATKVLDACRHFLGRIALREMAQRLELDKRQVTDAFKTLISRGLVYRAMRGIYRLTPKGYEALAEPIEIKSGPRGPRPMDLPHTSIRTRVWRAMRLCRKGSVQDLLMPASQGSANHILEQVMFANHSSFHFCDHFLPKGCHVTNVCNH